MNLRSRILAGACLLTAAIPVAALAQVLDVAPTSDRLQFGPPDTVRMRVGAEVTASRGACRNVTLMVAAPLDCPEQQVKIIAEDIAGDAQVDYRPVTGGEVNQMVITVSTLR